MIISTYDPYDGQASCPTCKKVQNIYTHSMNLAFPPMNIVFTCLECDTQVKRYINSDREEEILTGKDKED